MDEVKVSKASFIQWFAPLINALRELGGSATPEKARDQIARDLNLSSDVVTEIRGKTGGKKFDNEVAWARNYLAYEELIDKSVRGVWTLTPKGMEMKWPVRSFSNGLIFLRSVVKEIKILQLCKPVRQEALLDVCSR